MHSKNCKASLFLKKSWQIRAVTKIAQHKYLRCQEHSFIILHCCKCFMNQLMFVDGFLSGLNACVHYKIMKFYSFHQAILQQHQQLQPKFIDQFIPTNMCCIYVVLIIYQTRINNFVYYLKHSKQCLKM